MSSMDRASSATVTPWRRGQGAWRRGGGQRGRGQGDPNTTSHNTNHAVRSVRLNSEVDVTQRVSELSVAHPPYPEDLQTYIDECLIKKLRRFPEDLLGVLRCIWRDRTKTPYQRALTAQGGALDLLTKACRTALDELKQNQEAVNDASEDESVGFVPWVQDETTRTWYALFQVSFSASSYSMKLDPFRGTPRKGENPSSTACRELYEESCGLLQIPDGSLNSLTLRYVYLGHVYHVPVAFSQPNTAPEETTEGANLDFVRVLQRVVKDFDDNRRKMNTRGDKMFKETCGIAFVSKEELEELRSSNLPRFAHQVKCIRKKGKDETVWKAIKAMLHDETVEPMALERCKDDGGAECHFYRPTTGEEFHYEPGTPPEEREIQQDVLEINQTTSDLQDLKSGHDQKIVDAIRQIAERWHIEDETSPLGVFKNAVLSMDLLQVAL